MSVLDQRSHKQRALDEVLRERVQRGIALLEREVGTDWVDRIDLGRFDIRSGEACVLGQLYEFGDEDCPFDGRYARQAEKLGLDPDPYAEPDRDAASFFGFVVEYGSSDPDQRWKLLQDLWYNEIKVRQSATK